MSNEEPVEGKCNYHPTQDGGYCGQKAGMGTDHLGEGYCKYHGGCSTGGAREGAGAPKGNTNATTHGAYADCNSFYQNELSEELRQLADDIFADYLEKYRSLHGEPPLGHETELFRLSVTHVKDIVLDNWSTDRPAALESGNPMVDRETRTKTEKDKFNEIVTFEEHHYKESVVLAAQKKLSTDRRQWLKDLDLLHDADQKTADALEDGLDLTLSEADKEALDAANDVEPDTMK
ncbi:hypothetical protein HTZ84_05130 [Haloterrigena sp. SYSU A558-1]|uniref:Uncharacterized protein n=1 Tax=Haloterrigena gelatinilytica TaxID=2741724 RepID=A0ABX2L7I5_9EURY|nr:hypothetical protein [Haloterrigena gelatinilytica]NUC71696.1 hypothetical protein [Haloterrigena gelatinilytica]